MLKILKKTIKILLILILVLLVTAVSVPFLFKNKIKARLLTEIDKNLNAKVYFSELSFSSFKKFPRFTVTLHDAAVIGINEFAGDTLIAAKEISVSFNLYKIIKGNDIEIKDIDLEKPLIYVRVLKNGHANYAVMKEQDTTSAAPAHKKNFELAIDKWSINNGRIVYDDKLQKTYVDIGGLFHSGSGDFKQEISDLDITTKVNDLTVEYNNIRYFDKKLFIADLQMEMNLKDRKFTFKDHAFQLGEFKFGFDGFFKLLDNGYETDLKFVIKETAFKNLLSLLPGVYQKDMASIDTKGEFTCNGFIKGAYDVKDNKVPTFHVDFKVDKAMFKYNHLPKAVENINLDLIVDNPDRNPEHTSYNLKMFHLEMDKNPVHGSLCVKGKKHIYITSDIKLKADLAEIEKMFPINGLVLKGILNSEIKIDGHFNQEEKLFPKVDAFFTLTNGYVKSKQSPLDMDSIQVNAEVANSTGQLANTHVSLNKLTFLLDNEPFVMNGTLADMKDYNYKVKVDGLIDLAKLTQIYPVAETTVRGAVDMDFTTEGNLTDIEAKKYTLLKTDGTIEVKNVSYKNTEIAFPIHIDDALLTFASDKIVLNRFKAEFGKSNVTLGGHLYNYIPFLIRNDAHIKGDLTFDCDTLDMNEWFPGIATNTTTAVTKTAQVVAIPENIGFTFDSDIKMLKFGQLDIANLDGEIKVQNGTLTLNETGFNALDSKISLDGDYSTKDIKHPRFDMNISVDKMDFNKAYKTFVDPKGTCPASGNFSTKYAMQGEVTPNFSILYPTLLGKGKIVIDNVSVKGMKLMNHIKEITKKEEFNDPELADVTIESEIKLGRFLIYPFSFKVSKFLTEVEGDQGLVDGTINYFVKLSVLPFSKVKIPMSITGTSDKPITKMGKGFDKSDFERLE